jgi:hypothetical protein
MSWLASDSLCSPSVLVRTPFSCSFINSISFKFQSLQKRREIGRSSLSVTQYKN